MTVLEQKAGGGVDTDSIEVAERPVLTSGIDFWAHLLVGLAAVAIAVGAVVAANGPGLTGTDKLSRTRSLRSGRSGSLRTWRADTGRSLPRSTSRTPRELWSSTHVSNRRGSTRSGSGPRTWSREGGREADS